MEKVHEDFTYKSNTNSEWINQKQIIELLNKQNSNENSAIVQADGIRQVSR